MAVGVTTSKTTNCPGSGTIAATYVMASSTAVSTGDSVSITANNCVDGTTKINGGLAIRFNSIHGTPSSTAAWDASMTLTYTNLSMTDSGITESVNGDLTLNYNQTADSSASFGASGSSLSTTTTTARGTSSRTLTAYNYSGSVTAAGLYTFHDDFTFAGNLPRLGNNVQYTVKTLVDFQQQSGNYPSQGKLKITATDNTSLTLTVLNNTTVQIDLDTNGDGVIDNTYTKTWAELEGLL
jgi:hypothetical protein